MNPKAKTMLDAFARVQAPKPMVVEIGCIRMPDELASEGHSTRYLAEACRDRGVVLHSVDLSSESLLVARGVLERAGLLDYVEQHAVRGVHYLASLQCPIDFLYLDGGGGPTEHLQEFRMAERLLADGAVVCVDDCHQHGGSPLGKGTLLLPYAQGQGWQVEVVPTFSEYRMAVLWR